MKKPVFFLSCVLSAAVGLVACSRNKSDNSSTDGYGTTTSSTPVIYGVVNINTGYCGASTANVSLASGFSTTGNQKTVANGGSFTFYVTTGNYTLRAQAGSCGVEGTVNTQIGTVSPYVICLGNTCTTGKMTLAASEKAAPVKVEVCTWGSYGCRGEAGESGARVAGSTVTVLSKAAVSATVTALGGASLTSAAPALADGKTWTLSADHPGTYGARVNEAALQLNDGFCESSGNVIDRMAEYMELSGLGAASVAAFRASWAGSLPQASGFCVYPQETEAVAKSVRIDGAGGDNRRLWFLLIPQDALVQSRIKVPEKFSAALRKAQKNSFAALTKERRKTRVVASEGQTGLHEAGVVFLLER